MQLVPEAVVWRSVCAIFSSLLGVVCLFKANMVLTELYDAPPAFGRELIAVSSSSGADVPPRRLRRWGGVELLGLYEAREYRMARNFRFEALSWDSEKCPGSELHVTMWTWGRCQALAHQVVFGSMSLIPRRTHQSELCTVFSTRSIPHLFLSSADSRVLQSMNVSR